MGLLNSIESGTYSSPLLREDMSRCHTKRRFALCWGGICICAVMTILFSILSDVSIMSVENVRFEWSPMVLCKPFEVHLGVTDDPTSMRVTWRTYGEQCASDVRYRSADGVDAMTVQGFAYVGDSELLCGGTASRFRYRLHVHTAAMTELIPDASYVYMLPYDEREFVFRSMKQSGDRSPFVFYALADSGVARGMFVGAKIVQDSMMHEIASSGVPDFFLYVGDLANADGIPTDWDLFMRQIEPFAHRSPWIVGIGNHEYDIRKGKKDPWGLIPYQPSWGNMDVGTSDGECGLPMFWRFPTGKSVGVDAFLPSGENKTLPLPPYGSSFPPFYFSFRHGTVHVIMISTEHSVESDSTQIAWLEKELLSVDRCVTPFVIVAGHRPFYAPASHPGNHQSGLGLRNRLEDLLVRHRVDVYFSGHVHYYYRICEAKNGVCVTPGTGLVSVVIGSAGHKIRPLYPHDFSFDEMVVYDGLGFGKFTVNDERSMDFVFIESENGTVFDSHQFLNQGLCDVSA